ncbi:MAG: hypothetical protein HGB28_00500, partial [Oscillochloris sp.]|nr:hypothetical protein [Oscillochloris sp.]
MSTWHSGRSSRDGRRLRLLAAIVLLALGGLWLPVGSARAAGPITVGCVGTVGDTAELLGAISRANASAGSDTISLGASCVYTLGAVNNSTGGPNGLPVITGDLTIEGNGATITRGATAPAFRILKNASTLTLRNLTLANGLASGGNGGAIYNTGSLTLVSSTVIGSSARGAGGSSNKGGSGGGQGGAIYNTGTLVLNASTLANNRALGGNGVSRSHADSGGGGGGGAGIGGAIYSAGASSVTIINRTLSGNQAIGGQGGAGGDNGGSYSG